MTQWVKDLTTLAPSHCGGAGSIPGPGNFRMPGCSHKIKKKKKIWSFRRGTVEMNPTRNHEVSGSIPGLTQWVKALVLP